MKEEERLAAEDGHSMRANKGNVLELKEYDVNSPPSTVNKSTIVMSYVESQRNFARKRGPVITELDVE